MCWTSWAYSSGSPQTLGGNWVIESSPSRAASGTPSNIGVSRMPGAMVIDAHAHAGEFARRRQRQRGDGALGRRIGGLADLPVIGGDRGGVDDHPALAGRRWGRAPTSRRRRAASTLKLPNRLISTTRVKSSSAIGPPRPTMRPAAPIPAQLTTHPGDADRLARSRLAPPPPRPRSSRRSPPRRRRSPRPTARRSFAVEVDDADHSRRAPPDAWRSPRRGRRRRR